MNYGHLYVPLQTALARKLSQCLESSKTNLVGSYSLYRTRQSIRNETRVDTDSLNPLICLIVGI